MDMTYYPIKQGLVGVSRVPNEDMAPGMKKRRRKERKEGKLPYLVGL